MVLFGGYRWLGGTSIFYSETWEYAGGEWIQPSAHCLPTGAGDRRLCVRQRPRG
ncbi:MAG: hypothetical protein R2856_24425 [Caldilineaceae bacterium]